MQFDRKVSIGNLWTIGVVAVGLIYGWAQFGNDIHANARDLRSVEQRITILENNFQGLLRELATERVTMTRILTEIQTDIRYIKER